MEWTIGSRFWRCNEVFGKLQERVISTSVRSRGGGAKGKGDDPTSTQQQDGNSTNSAPDKFGDISSWPILYSVDILLIRLK